MWLFLAFLAIPLVEIALFVKIGGAIGLGWTLATVVMTAILGAWLVRTQGAVALRQLRSSFDELRDPTEPLAHGAMILFSGVLLLTPGFFTDAIGFLLLIPAVRAWAFRRIRERISVQTMHSDAAKYRRSAPRGGDVIEGEYDEVRPEKTPGGRPSGWTRH